ncbi:MAG TPA: pseudouridine synthase [Usitatibacter sp.]|nr:pseudouridine synthase [Usitatibacter sp.]
MSRVLLLNKPHGVICQFTGDGRHPTLKDFIDVPHVYPAGRLDTDSEGLVVLTDEGRLQTTIADPRHKLEKAYWVQVEGEPSDDALARLAAGVTLNDGPTLPAFARAIEAPAELWERDPPIRFRKAVPTAWIEIRLREGRNRQVRRMTAAVGLPTLRLVRHGIGPWTISGLALGQWREVPASDLQPPPR